MQNLVTNELFNCYLNQLVDSDDTVKRYRELDGGQVRGDMPRYRASIEDIQAFCAWACDRFRAWGAFRLPTVEECRNCPAPIAALLWPGNRPDIEWEWCGNCMPQDEAQKKNGVRLRCVWHQNGRYADEQIEGMASNLTTVGFRLIFIPNE